MVIIVLIKKADNVQLSLISNTQTAQTANNQMIMRRKISGMKLIIDIPEDVYNKITEIYNSCEELHTRENLYQTIVNGIPLAEFCDSCIYKKDEDD